MSIELTHSGELIPKGQAISCVFVLRPATRNPLCGKVGQDASRPLCLCRAVSPALCVRSSRCMSLARG